LKFKEYLKESKVVHWKKSKFSKFAACDKRGAESLSIDKCKNTEKAEDVTCKKCRKEYMGLGRYNIWGEK